MSSLYTKGVNNIYATDFESQKHYITVVANELRKADPEELYNFKCFFVPNNDYMRIMFGDEILNTYHDVYDADGMCKWHGCLMIPIQDLTGEVIAFVGYDVFQRLENVDNEARGMVYRYSALRVFQRSNYIHVRPDIYFKAIKDGYIFTPDGTFDMIYSVANGLNACSLFGSYVNDSIIFQLKFIDRVYIPADNDNAGEMLAKRLKARLGRNAIVVRQNKLKDIDDVLKSEYKTKYLDAIKNHISKGYSHDLYIKL